jgi:hypothetical protein
MQIKCNLIEHQMQLKCTPMAQELQMNHKLNANQMQTLEMTTQVGLN